jgi:hypothetical protein
VASSGSQAWFIAGTIPLIVGGGAHVLGILVDTVRPTYFAPVDGGVKPEMEGTGIRLVRMCGGGEMQPSVWRVWLGIHISHGLGVLAFGLLLLLIAASDFAVVERIDAIRPLAIAFSLAYLLLSFRFWFWGPAVLTGVATTCFTVATVLSA